MPGFGGAQAAWEKMAAEAPHAACCIADEQTGSADHAPAEHASPAGNWVLVEGGEEALKEALLTKG